MQVPQCHILLPAPAATRQLSPREAEILLWFASGKSTGEVATILGISAATVMFHYRQVTDRWGTANRTHTVSLAIREQLLHLDASI